MTESEINDNNDKSRKQDNQKDSNQNQSKED